MSNLHRTLSDDQIHVAKGFSTGVAGSDLWKNENSAQEFIAKVAFPPALDFKDGNAAPPISPTTGDIYVLVDLGNGTVDAGWSTGPGAGYNDWVRWSGFFWVPITPQEGAICYNKQDDDYYKFDGSDWVSLGGSLTLKTVNNESLLGVGNVDVRGDFRTTSALSNKNFIQNKPIFFPAIDFIDGNATPPVSFTNDVYVLVDMGNGVINAGWDGASYNDWVVRGTGQWFSTSPTNGVTCYDKTSKINKRYNGTSWVPADTGGGKLAIYNSSGVPTFYDTWPLAIAAAVSGDVIEVFADMTVTSTITLPANVHINGNGHRITMSLDDATGLISIGLAGTNNLSNITFYRTGRANNSSGVCLSIGIGPATNLYVNCNNVNFINTYGMNVYSSGNYEITGAYFEGYQYAFYQDVTNVTSKIIKCSWKGYVQIYNSGVEVYDSVGFNLTGTVISTYGSVYNSILKSVSGFCGAGVFHNCTLINNLGSCVSGGVYNSSCWTNAGTVASGGSQCYNSYLRTSSGYVFEAFHGSNVYPPYGAIFKECTMIADANRATNRTAFNGGNTYIGNTIRATTYGIYDGPDSIVIGNNILLTLNTNNYIYINGSFKGMNNNGICNAGTIATPVVGTNTITATTDSQGNTFE